jgi:hypothetical protein
VNMSLWQECMRDVDRHSGLVLSARTLYDDDDR